MSEVKDGNGSIEMIYAVYERNDIDPGAMVHAIMAFGILGPDNIHWNILMNCLKKMQNYDTIDKVDRLRVFIQEIVFVKMVESSQSINHWHSAIIDLYEKIRKTLESEVTEESWKYIQELIRGVEILANSDVNQVAATLREFEKWIKFEAPKVPNQFSIEKWKILAEQFQFLKTNLKAMLQLVVCLNPKYIDCWKAYISIENLLETEPKSETWNRIIDTMHVLVNFQLEVNPGLKKSYLLNKISIAAVKAASVIGAIPNHPYISELDVLLEQYTQLEK